VKDAIPELVEVLIDSTHEEDLEKIRVWCRSARHLGSLEDSDADS
jgi:hypothetical protein